MGSWGGTISVSLVVSNSAARTWVWGQVFHGIHVYLSALTGNHYAVRGKMAILS